MTQPPKPPTPAQVEAERQQRIRDSNDAYWRKVQDRRDDMARQMEADTREQAQLLAHIIDGHVRPHEVDPKLLKGDKAKETLVIAKRIWDMLFIFRLDSLANEALEFLGETMRDDTEERTVRVDAAKTILSARGRMAAKNNNPGEAAVRALIAGLGGGGGGSADLRNLDDAELLQGFKRLLLAATDEGG